VYNINDGRNAEMANRCEELNGYAYFVHRVRFHEAEEKRKGEVPKEDILRIALRKAVQDCIKKGLLLGFWNSLTPEEFNMLVAEWDVATEREVEREEAYEKGLEQRALNMLKKGFSYEETAELSMLDIAKIKELSQTIER